ncbi:MAG: RDD family protein [Chlamydiales bacterium]|nr:RDD family protein [Chlamydiales bacterium]
MTEIIEPSEIITGEDRIYTKPKKANPWIRGVARLVDYSLFCLFLCLCKIFFHYEKGSIGFLENLIPFEFFCWIPLETLFLVLWGKTPGKWFLRIDLQFGRKKRADLMTALQRSFSVWWRGLGLGIPFLNGLCMLTAYYRLTTMQTTSWDREGHVYVSHHPIPRWRVITATLFGLGGLFLYRTC